MQRTCIIIIGGVEKLMLGAGKDCTDMFNRYHAWVNCDQMLSKCLVGYLIEEEQTIEEEDEDEEEEEEKNSGDFKGALQEADAKNYKTVDNESKGKAYDREDEELLRAQAKMSLEMPYDD